MRVRRRVKTAVGASTVTVLLRVALALPAWAHGARPPLEFYGDFGPSAARCQRTIGRAAGQCVAEVVRARSACMNAQFDGDTCDAAATDALVQAARHHARDVIQQVCSEQDAGSLQFVSVAEVQADVAAACSDLENAAVSVTFGPAFASGTTGAVDGMPRVCMMATAQETLRLVKFAARVQRRALDHVVAAALTPTQKLALLNQAARRIARARSAVQTRILASCSDADFASLYGRSLDSVLGAVQQRTDCIASSAYVQAAVTCPASVCGNGVQEPGEQCDDGNTYDADACHNDCTKNDCQLFPSTFDLIQQAIFEQHGCTSQLCHGSDQPQGGLDLRKGHSYDNLVDAPSQISTMKRVEPGDEDLSLFWLKLAASTLKRSGVPGSPMPLNLPALNEGELEALRRWIHDGAPRTGVVRGTAALLNACLPPPEPIEIRKPDPPASGTGVQLHMPKWILPPTSENEVCFSTYYDITDQVPAQFVSPDGKHFRYNHIVTTQDPLSHHLIANSYAGEFPADDPSWGEYHCNGGSREGALCNPYDLTACGAGGDCATAPVRTVACIGIGPVDNQLNITNFGFTGTQETVASNTYPAGVFAELPLKGVVIWNSHAFNLADKPGKLEGWLNIYFAPPPDQQYALQPLLDTDAIFVMRAPAFGTDDVCHIHVMPPGAQLFELSSHMHRRGKRFQTFRGAFRCRDGAKSGEACWPALPDYCGAGNVCSEDTGRDPIASLMYTSLIYDDPVVLRFDPPLLMAGSDAERSLTFCAHYDNGFTDPADVKRKSTSAVPPLLIGLGGPCTTPTNCVSGKPRQPCSGRNAAQRNASCDSEPGKGDGFCDACPSVGGVTTDDEMFVLTGSFYFK